MTFTKEGNAVNGSFTRGARPLAYVYDHVPAHTVEVSDQIAHENDLIEITRVVDSG